MGPFDGGMGGLRLDDVALEGETPEGTAVVGHLSVIVDAAGITVLGPTPGDKRTLAWERMSSVELGPTSTLPGDQAVNSLQFVLDGRPLRFLLPASGAVSPADARDETDAALPAVDDATTVVAAPVMVGPAHPEPAVPAPPVVPPAEAPLVTAVYAPVADPNVDAAPAPTVEASPEPDVHLIATSAIDATPEPVVEAVTVPAVDITTAPVVDTTPVPTIDTTVEHAVTATAEPVVAATPEAPVAPPPEPAVAATPEPRPAAVVEPVVAAVVEVAVSDERPLAVVETVVAPHAHADHPPTTAPAAHIVPARRPSPVRKAPRRKSQHVVQVALVTLLVGLVPIVAGVWYFHDRTPARPPGAPASDAAIARRVGIQRNDLPAGWTSQAATGGEVFAAGAGTSRAAQRTAGQASSVLARCLHVPVSALDGAFGMGDVGAVTAQALSPAYNDPDGNGGAVASVVAVVDSVRAQQADAQVFKDPALFATCYQPFAQAMLPFVPRSGPGAGKFATATVQPLAVPVPLPGGGMQVAGFQIARIGNDDGQTVTTVTTAVAVFDGRVQATLASVSNFVFPIDTQTKLIQDIEARVVGLSLY